MSTGKKYAETPLMKQYYQVKRKHPDTILLFRVGDFYETFGEDAIKTAEILGITLTKRASENMKISYLRLINGLKNFSDRILFRKGKRFKYLLTDQSKEFRSGSVLCISLHSSMVSKARLICGIVIEPPTTNATFRASYNSSLENPS